MSEYLPQVNTCFLFNLRNDNDSSAQVDDAIFLTSMLHNEGIGTLLEVRESTMHRLVGAVAIDGMFFPRFKNGDGWYGDGMILLNKSEGRLNPNTSNLLPNLWPKRRQSAAGSLMMQKIMFNGDPLTFASSHLTYLTHPNQRAVFKEPRALSRVLPRNSILLIDAQRGQLYVDDQEWNEELASQKSATDRLLGNIISRYAGWHDRKLRDRLFENGFHKIQPDERSETWRAIPAETGIMDRISLHKNGGFELDHAFKNEKVQRLSAKIIDFAARQSDHKPIIVTPFQK